MAFLFGKSKKANPAAAAANALPPASRDIRSSDGPSGSSASQIPTLNGIAGIPKPGSPTPGAAGSVNNSLNSLAGNETVRSGQPQQQQERGTFMGGGGGEGARMSVAPSPEQKMLRDRNMEPPRQRTASGQAPGRPGPGPPQDASPYPWSSRPMSFPSPTSNPFPRYGAAVNATASKDGAIYIMGGLVNGTTVKGDLWTVEPSPAGLSCSVVATTSEGPGPRVGHASLLVGNAFIVFGGDTKMEEGDMLDDTLYLLNTSTKQWSRALPAGPRPPGRYGHTLNILGSKIYIFGGQVEGYFFNDLYAFDLNALQAPTNKWELLVQNTIDGGPPHGQIPPARTNHTIITYGDRLYLFGGTDGVHWFNDVWSYSPQINSWTQLECIGYIPSPREGHAAALVGDVMYIFGGRTEDGNDLGDLAAFRISSRRWYTFQNMGPSPSPRSGHTMTTVGKQIVVLAGEPSSAPRDPVELSHAYFLDTSKIRYPPDTSTQGPQNNDTRGIPGQNLRPSMERPAVAPPLARPPQGMLERDQQQQQLAKSDSLRARESRLPQSTRSQQQQQQQFPAPAGPPPAAPLQQSRSNNSLPVAARQPTRPMSPGVDAERAQNFERNASSPQIGSSLRAPLETAAPSSVNYQTYYDDDVVNESTRQPVQTYQPSQDEDALNQSTSSRDLGQSSMDEEDEPQDPVNKSRNLQQPDERPQDSGIGSSPSLSQQYDDLIRQLEQTKQRNAWYASELALARKSGYQSRSLADSPVLDDHSNAADVFSEDDKPLVEALLKMRAELARVQTTIDEQSRGAAERIAEMQKQRDAAISEAVYAKTRLAGQQGGSSPSLDNSEGGKRSPDQDRRDDMGRRLASSLSAQTELSRRIDGLIHEVEAEKKARQLAEEAAESAQKRAFDLANSRQDESSLHESLRAELNDSQSHARDLSASHAEIKSKHDMLAIDKEELSGKLESALAETSNHAAILSTLQTAVAASSAKAQLLEQRLEEERGSRDGLETKLRQLRSEHEERTVELESTSRRLRDAESLAEKHADEARTHRDAVLAGLGKVTDRGVDPSAANDSRVAALQAQVDGATALVRQNQAAADAASAKLRSAEERIAGLETFQEQVNRDGLSIRKQLQNALKENQGLSAAKAELEQKVQSQMLETNALAVQHASLKDILSERGINASEVRRSRAMDSPISNLSSRFSTPDLQRMRDLEQQLEASLRSHDDMKAQYEEVSERDEKMRSEYENQLGVLRKDHGAAVNYLRGTEKMLSKMKQELQRVKTENSELRRRADEFAESEQVAGGGRAVSENGSTAETEAEAERERLRSEYADAHASFQSSISALEAQVSTLQTQLHSTESDLSTSRTAHATSQADLQTLQQSHESSRSDLERLKAENALLDARARDAEKRIYLLLDQVEHSVDNYRRQSRLTDGTANVATMNGVYRHSRSLSGLSGRESVGDGMNFGAGVTGNSALGALPGHSRGLSDGGNSVHSTASGGLGAFLSGSTAEGESGLDSGELNSGEDGRNSLALDSLASELETLRSHWETTNKNYRLSSERFEFERGASASRGGLGGSSAGAGASAGGAGAVGGAHVPSSSLSSAVSAADVGKSSAGAGRGFDGSAEDEGDDDDETAATPTQENPRIDEEDGEDGEEVAEMV